MSDWVRTILATNNPKLSAAASQQGTKFISINQNPAVLRQFNHLFWGGGGMELTPHLWVTIHLMDEVIQGIQ